MAAVASTSTVHPQMSRPTVKRTSHTWPRPAAPRNHFEDFMHEIGAPVHNCQLCCVPRPVKSSRPHKSPERPTSKSRAVVDPTSDRSVRPSHTRTNTSDANPRVSTHRSAWFSLGTAASSERKVSRFPVSTLVKAGAMSRLFKSNASASVATDPCVLHASTFHHPDSPPASAQASLRAALGDISPDHEEDGRMAEVALAEAYEEAPDESSSANSSPHDVDAAVSPRPLSRSVSFDSLTTATSSLAPATPRGHSPLPLSPVLVDLENHSRFRVEAVCITCKKTGSNFPSCVRCGEQWCSRDCRVKGGAGRKHACLSRSHERDTLTGML